MPGIGPYPYPTAANREPTLQDKLDAVRRKYPYAQLPPDFGSDPADAVALDRLSSPIPEWMQRTGSKVSEFFGGNKPNSNEMMSRVGSMKGSGGRSMSDAQYRGALQVGRMLVEHAVPGGMSGRTGQMVTRANQLYNTEVKGIGMSARGALSAKSMLSDVMEMSGYAPNPSGGYVQTRDVNKDVIGAIYAEAAGRGLNPTEVAMEKMATAVALENPDVQERIITNRPVPLWQDDSGVVVTDSDLEEGPNRATKMMRYVPKFMEQNLDKA